MNDFIRVEVAPTHTFRLMPISPGEGFLRLGDHDYGLHLDAAATLGPHFVSTMTLDAPDLSVRLSMSGLQVKGEDNLWQPLSNFSKTHAVDECQDAWKEAINAILAAPIKTHQKAMPFYDRTRIYKWSREGIDMKAPIRLLARLHPDRLQRKREWRADLSKTIEVDWPKATQASPQTGQEISTNLLWSRKIQQQVEAIEWHDPLLFGFKFDPSMNSHIVFIDGLRSGIPLGVRVDFTDTSMTVGDTISPLGGVQAYIGSVMLAVMELAMRTAPSESDVLVVATAGEDTLAVLTIEPDAREIDLVMLIQDWPQAGLGADNGFVWYI